MISNFTLIWLPLAHLIFLTFNSSEKRDKTTICVVQTWHDLFAIEKAGGYQGVYHVLGGALCPLEGIGPDDLHIDSLLKRVNESVKEIIFATNPTPEGEATASYISSNLEEIDFDLSSTTVISPVILPPRASHVNFPDNI